MPFKKNTSRTKPPGRRNSVKTSNSSKNRASGNTKKTGQSGGKKNPATIGSAENKNKTLHSVNPSGKRDQSFFELVYEVARQIPYGRVTSYGAIAACLGTKLSARMVGWAMNGAGKINPPVPAHRVVNRVGLLSGKLHFGPPEKMEKLLRKEGVLVKDDMVVNFKEKFWDPAAELL
jgi:methylated-DNA-protein-cysteine methyltransferase-like protein